MIKPASPAMKDYPKAPAALSPEQHQPPVANTGDSGAAQRRKSAVARLSVGSNTTLVLAKLIIGLCINSVSVISEAIHSGVDLVAAVIALVAVNNSHKPADDEHPYGHGKIENLSGAIEALLIMLAGVWIIVESVIKLLHHEPMRTPIWGVAVMLLSALVNIFVSHRLFTVGNETGSPALQADAWHLRTDVWTSFGVMAGLVVVLAGRRLFPGVALDWVDPAAAIAVALLILSTAWRLTAESARDLLDARLPEEEVQWIEAYLLQPHPNMHGLHKLRTRKSGVTRYVEFHLVVEDTLSVADAHQITDDLTTGIRTQYPDTIVTIHVEPCDPARCHNKCIGCREGAAQG